MSIPSVTLTNTFGEFVLSTDLCVSALNTLETGNYTKSSGTLIVTSASATDLGFYSTNRSEYNGLVTITGAADSTGLIVTNKAEFDDNVVFNKIVNVQTLNVVGDMNVLGNTITDTATIILQVNSGSIVSPDSAIVVNRGESANVLNQNAVLRWNNSQAWWDVKDVAANTYARLLTTDDRNVINNTANTSFLTIEQSFLQANLAFNQANTSIVSIGPAFDIANNASIYSKSAFAQANMAFSQANVVFVQANSGINYSQSSFSTANNGVNYSKQAFSFANNGINYSQSAFDTANNGSVYAKSAFGQANLAFVQANTGINYATSAFVKANSSGVLAASANTLATTAYDSAIVAAPVGSIIAFPCDTSLPSGWLPCFGYAISRTTYAKLYSIIGGTYGVGDGSSTFNVPDFRGCFLRCSDSGRGLATTASYGTYQASDNKSHTHTITDPGHAHSYTTPAFDYASGFVTGGPSYSLSYPSYTTSTSTTSISINSSGGTESRPLNYSIVYLIKL